MIKRIGMSALIAASLVTSSVAFEQQGVKKGNSVVGVDVRYTSSDTTVGSTTTNSTMSNINVAYSMFATDAIEIGATAGISSSDNAGTTSTTNNYSAFVGYNFVDMAPTVVPYVSAGVAMYVPDQGDSLTGYNAEGGINIFLSEKAAVVPAVYYQSFENYTTTGGKIALKVYF